MSTSGLLADAMDEKNIRVLGFGLADPGGPCEPGWP